MAEEKTPKAERRVKFRCKNSIYIDGGTGRAVKVNKGMGVLLTDKEAKHFKANVTKDFEDDIKMFSRGDE